MILVHRALLLVAVLTAAGCATVPERPADAALGNHGLPVATDVEQCRARLREGRGAPGSGFDGDEIRMLSWNIRKGSADRWREDLVALASDRDLVLIQEAVLGPDLARTLPDLSWWAFGPGYQSGAVSTGVATFSRVAPLAHCYLNTTEPLLKTPKATMVTEYALAGTEDTLVVVNVHAVNFSLGLAAFRAQLEQIREVLAEHGGPTILSGDFNTWREARMAAVRALTDELGLVPLTFAEDLRTAVFGLHLDHIFVGGLAPRTTQTRAVASSDHNPLSAVLRK